MIQRRRGSHEGAGTKLTLAQRPAGVTPHSFRHGLATRLLEAGVPMRVAAEQLGQSSTRITEDIYTHVTPGLSRAAAEAIEEVYPRIGA